MYEIEMNVVTTEINDRNEIVIAGCRPWIPYEEGNSDLIKIMNIEKLWDEHPSATMKRFFLDGIAYDREGAAHRIRLAEIGRILVAKDGSLIDSAKFSAPIHHHSLGKFGTV